MVDLSVIVDFDRRGVSGFWIDVNGLPELIPITATDANSVTFKGGSKGSIQLSISGTIDRVTGKVDAQETVLWRTGSLSQMAWDLRCTPARP
jgi:hypothetical protein